MNFSTSKQAMRGLWLDKKPNDGKFWLEDWQASSSVNEQVTESEFLWKMSETAVACNICGSSYTLPGNKQRNLNFMIIRKCNVIWR